MITINFIAKGSMVIKFKVIKIIKFKAIKFRFKEEDKLDNLAVAVTKDILIIIEHIMVALEGITAIREGIRAIREGIRAIREGIRAIKEDIRAIKAIEEDIKVIMVKIIKIKVEFGKRLDFQMVIVAVGAIMGLKIKIIAIVIILFEKIKYSELFQPNLGYL